MAENPYMALAQKPEALGEPEAADNPYLALVKPDPLAARAAVPNAHKPAGLFAPGALASVGLGDAFVARPIPGTVDPASAYKPGPLQNTGGPVARPVTERPDRALGELASDMAGMYRHGAKSGLLALGEAPYAAVNAINTGVNAGAAGLAGLFGQEIAPEQMIRMVEAPEALQRERAILTDEFADFMQGGTGGSSAALRYDTENRPDDFIGALGYSARNPGSLAPDAAQTVGAMTTGLLPGVGAAGNIGLQATQQASLAAQDVEQALLSKGVDPQTAKAEASKAFAAILGVGVVAPRMFTGGAALERLAGGEASGLTGSMARRVATPLIGEPLSEIVEEGSVQAIQNDYSGDPLGQGVGASAALGGLLGFGMGAGPALAELGTPTVAQPRPFPNAAPRQPAPQALEAPPSTAIDPAILAAGNAALGAAPAAPTAPAAPGPLGQPEDTSDIDAMLAANIPPEVAAQAQEVAANATPEQQQAAMQVLGELLDPSPAAPSEPASSPAQPESPADGVAATNFMQQAAASMRMRSQEQAARTAAPAAQSPAAPVGSRPAGGDLAPAKQNAATTGDTLTMQNRDRSRAAAVAQMQDIRKNPDADRLGFSRDPNTGAPMVGAGREVPAADVGRTDTVVMASGRRVPVRYAVVEAEDVAASHDADGRANPGYDAAPLKALNNGRTAGLQAAYAGGNADAYRQGIAADEGLHGVSAAAIASKRNPVLVRLYDPAANTGDMGAESNASAQLGLSPVEQAQTDARGLPDLSGLRWAEDGSISPAGNSNFFRAWFANMGEAQAASLQDAQGRPNAAALQRVRAAMVHRAYGDERLLTAMAEEVNPDNRNVMNALVQAAPAFATLERGGLTDDMREALVGGLETLRDASARGLSLADALGQGDLLGRNTHADTVARFMAENARSAKRIAEAFKAMAEYAADAESQAATLDVFGNAPAADIGEAFNRAGIDNDTGSTASRVAEGRGGRESAQDERAAAGDAFTLQAEQPRAEAPREVAPSQGGGLFGAPTTRDFIDSAQRGRDAARNGRAGTGRTDMLAGDGELFAGARPEQARVPDADRYADMSDAELRFEAKGSGIKSAASMGRQRLLSELRGLDRARQQRKEASDRAVADWRESVADLKGKQPWEMTPAEWGRAQVLSENAVKGARGMDVSGVDSAREAFTDFFGYGPAPGGNRRHEVAVLTALQEGKPVPESVRAAYRGREAEVFRYEPRHERAMRELLAEPDEALENTERDLVVTHNLTGTNLMHAIRMGGLAVPSLAVTRGDSSITGFGDITLIGDPDLADPRRGAKAFGADVYSPRYPEITYRLDAAAVRRLNKAIGADGARWQVNSTVRDVTGEDAFRDYMTREFGDNWRIHDAEAEAARLLRESGATEHTFEGFTYSGNRRYKPHTLENVVKKLKRELRGGEDFNYGVGSLRAKFTPQFRSVDAIRKAKGRIVSPKDFERIKEEIDGEFFEVVNVLSPFSDRGESFGFGDAVIDMMGDAAKMGIPRALREYGINDVPAEVQVKIAGFLDKLRHLPTEYFEIIQPRAVEINEFRAAVIPSDTKPEVRDALTSRGLAVIEYKHGDENSRRAAVKQAAESSAALFNEERGQSAPAETPPAGSDLPEISRRMGEADAERLGLRAAVNEALGKVGEKVIFLRDTRGLPEHLRRGVERRLKQREGKGMTAALYDTVPNAQGGHDVYIITSVVRSPSRAVWNALHEIAGHEGLRKLLGDRLNHALEIALQNPTVRALAEAIADERKIDFTTENGRMLAAEEALAELAAAVRTGNFAEIEGRYAVPVPDGIRERLTRAIENFLKRLKAMVDDIFGRHQFTDEDVRALLENAWQAVNQPANGELAPDLDGVDATAPDQTQTPAFRKWFGDSKVVDENGKPLVVYHGTTKSFDRFDHRMRSGLGGRAGFWFASDAGALDTFTRERMIGDAPNVMPVFLSIRKPAEFDGHAGFVAAVNERNGATVEDRIKSLRTSLIRRGYDGIVIHGSDTDGGVERDDWVAFEPEQIKSATANRGTFDPDSPSILESVEDARDRAEARRNEAAGTLPVARGAAGWNYDAGKWEGRKGQANNARAHLQDKMLAWRDVQGQIEANLQAAIPDAQNVYRLENLMHGRVGEGIDRIEREQVKPLVDAMRAAKVEPATLEEYLYARHAQERNAQIAAINPAMPDGGSGMTNADAARILASADRATLDPLARRVDAIAKATRHRLLANGLITQEAFDAMEAQYEHYVPLRGKQVDETEDFGRGGTAGRGLDSRGKPVRNALGRGAGNRAQNILGEVIGDAERSVILAEKARVGRGVMRIVLANPNPSLWQVEPVQTERALDASGEVYEKVVNDWSDPSVVAVRHKGQLYRVQINSVPLAKALNNVGVDQLGGVTRMAGVVNRYFSAILTKYNPAFTPVNASRDALFGLTGLAAEHGEAAALDAALHYPQAARAAFRQARGAEGDSQWDRWAAEFAAAGGKTGYVNMPSAEEIARKIGSGSLTSYSPTGLRRAASVVGEAVGVLNDAVENALRLSAYVTLRKRGQSAEAAAAYAKDLTVNFNRKGFDGSKLNAWFLFYNASIQGAHRVSKLARKPKTWGYLGALATAQVIATLAAMGMEDDNGEPLWNKVPDHVKRRNIVIVTPDGGLITIPMPYGFNLFPYIAGRITESVVNRERGEKRASDGAAQLTADFIGSGLESFSPVPLDDGVAGLLPTLLRIPVNVWANRNDFGRPIRMEQPYAKSDVPRASMGRPDTLQVFKLMSQGLNRLGGGDDLTPPPLSAFDVAPEDLEYLVKTFTGGPGNLVVDIATIGQKITGGDYAQDATARDIPITKRFVSNIDEQAAQAAMFYDRRETIDRSLKRVRLAFKTEGAEAAEKLLAATPELTGAVFRRRKKEGRHGEPPGSIILVGGNPQIVVGESRNRGTRGPVRNPGELSVYAAYKAAEEAIRTRNENVETAYAGSPAGLTPNRQRDAFIRTENNIRQAAQSEFNAAWVRDVVGAAE